MTNRLLGLDMLRGIAAPMVVVYHSAHIAGEETVFSHAYLAVDFFFLLSGFVMAATFEPKMTAMGASGFLKMRFLRLAPLMAVGATISIVSWLMIGTPWSQLAIWLALALLFLPAVDKMFHINESMWSIHFEMFANICHVLFFHRLSAVVLLVIAAFALELTLVFHGWKQLYAGMGATYFLGFPRVITSYCFGIVLWRLNGVAPRGRASVAFGLFPLIIVAASFLPWMDLFTVAILNPLLLVNGLGFGGGKTETAVARFMGAWSFPLYATHWPVVEIAIRSGASMPEAVCCAVFVSLLIGMLFDKRMRMSLGSLASVKADDSSIDKVTAG